MANPLARVKIAVRLYALLVIVALGMGGMMYFSSVSLDHALQGAYGDRTKSLVDVGFSLLQEYKQRVETGELTLEDSKLRALKRLGSIRFDGDNYIWINDMDGVMLMHPTASMIGKNVLGTKDRDGKLIFDEMIALVKREGESVYTYQWPPNETAKPKISYVKGDKDWNWVIGTGVFTDQIRRDVMSETKNLAVAVGGLLLLILLIAVVIGRSISSPILGLNKAMQRLADGDLDSEIGFDDRSDEIGAMAKTVHIFQENARQVASLKAEQAEMERRAATEKKRTMNQMADDFEHSVGGIVNVVASAATELQSSAKNLSEMADQTSRQTSTVAAATEEASTSVQTVASAAEELSASISEINRQVEESSRVAASAVQEVKRTDATVSTLSEAASQIGDVVKLIQDIAEQTNLLALNATIEAARAGEAGKGFAVVASEVKNLANQTAKATEEISSKIVTVQNVSKESVDAIRGIGGTIEHINEITATIAHALSQQEMATQEISKNVQQASAGTNEVSGSIASVTEVMNESQSGASEVLRAATDLSKQADSLKHGLEDFLKKLLST